MKFSMRLDGVNGYVKAVNEMARTTPKAVMNSMEARGAGAILRAAIPLTPIDTGALRRSGAVYPVRAQGTRFSAVVGFGNENVRYALRQHEDTSLRHPRGGQAKFLEEGTRRAAKSAHADLAADVAKAWKAAAGK